MKRDLFKELGIEAENSLLNDQETRELKGGVGRPSGWNQNGLRCILDGNNLLHCTSNVCDPSNAGNCPGNTVGGGPKSCPLSA